MCQLFVSNQYFSSGNGAAKMLLLWLQAYDCLKPRAALKPETAMCPTSTGGCFSLEPLMW